MTVRDAVGAENHGRVVTEPLSLEWNVAASAQPELTEFQALQRGFHTQDFVA